MGEDQQPDGHGAMTGTQGEPDRLMRFFMSLLDREEVRAVLAEQLRSGRVPADLRRNIRAFAASTVDSYARQFARDIYARAGLAWSIG